MGVEEHRKKLMANNPTWGDRRFTHVADGPCENPDDNLCSCEVGASTLSTPVDLMNHVVNPPSPLDSRISTCGWIFEDLLKKGKRFRPVPRVPLKEATRAIIRFDKDGVPLIIEGLHKESSWPKEDFHPDWLKDNGYKEISVRNVYDWTDKTMIFEDFIEKSRSMPTFASPQEQERLYGKDAKCPGKWAKWLCDSQVVPSPLIPDNVDDLLSSRHVETLMCYIGVGDTFTPCHKDLCASSGQNLMCYAEMDGSSFWFMTKGADAPEASKYFHELKQELDHETHVITVEQLANAPFDVYIAEQRLGDLVLVPPRSCHQVVNYGGITIKTSWSRMTLRGLEIAYYHELPIYRRVCRPEIYRVKSTIFQTLIKRRDILLSLKGQAVPAPKTGDKKLISTTKDLLNLFDSVLLEESPTPNRRFPCLQPITSLNHSPDSLVISSTLIDQLTCDFCGADIFQSFFECLSCVNAPNGSKIEHGDGFVICAGCYIEGRSCKCGNMDPMQCRPFQELLAVRNKVADLLSVNKHDLIPSLKDSTSTLATGIFRAACKLQEIRKTRKGEERTCSTIVAGSSHLVPCSWVLNCKKCHRSRCFKHILTSQKLHSADALLIHASDSSHEEHHRHHGSSLQNYDEGSDRFFQTQRMGSKPDFTQQRAHLAEQYHTCKPLNSAFIQAGWYDVHVQLVPTIIEAKDNSTNSSQDSLTPPASPPLSPLTDLDSPLPLQVLPAPVKTTTVANMSLSLKRKRTVLDFVDVPSRMHKVRVSERLAVTPGGPEPSKSQETFPDLQVTSQLLSSDSTTPSVTADNVICERDQEVMQTDPLSSPPISRRNKASSHSTSQMLLILSTSEADSSNSSSFPSHKNKSKKQTFKKPQPLPSSPTSVMSRSTPILPRLTSSTLTRSPQPVNQLQTRIVSSTGESEKNSRLDRSFPPPITPDLGLARITDSEESRRKLVPVRKLPRIKKTFRTTQRVSPEVSSCQSSSSSSVYPRSTSTPSDVIDLAQVINGAVNKNYSALEALDADPPLTEQTPSNNNTATQAVHTTLTDSAALHKAISDITDAARNMTQLHNMPSQSHDPIRAAATAPGEFTSYHSQYTIVPPPPWFQGNCFPFFYPASSSKWPTSEYSYQQSSQYHDVRYYAAPPFEGGPSLRSPVEYSRFPHEKFYQEDGSNMRSGTAYSSARRDFYRADHNRRSNNRGHPYRPWQSGAQVRGRPPRSTMRFEKSYRRPHSSNNPSFRNSHSRTNNVGGGMPNYNRPTESAPRAEMASISTFQSQCANYEANDQSNKAVENLVGKGLPCEESSSPRLPSGQLISSSVPEPPIDRPWARSPGSQARQHDKADRVQELPSSPSSANAENGRSLERFGSPTHSANWEDDYEQEDFVIDKEVPWTDRLTQQQAKSSKPIQEQNEPSKFVQQQTEPSKPIQQHTEPSKPIQQNEFTFDSLYDNPWAS